MSFDLVCGNCGERYDNSKYRTTCQNCSGFLRIKYDTPCVTSKRINTNMTGMARYLPMLPISNSKNLVTMGEGNTPIVLLSRVSQSLGIDGIHAKLEYMNPTGAFKDRGNAIQVSVLKETGVDSVAEIGGGNTGHSLAAYCAKAGITFEAFTFEGDENRKVQTIMQTGAKMHWVNGTRQDAVNAMNIFCSESGTLNLSYQLNTYFIEGNKTIAYEIAEQMDPVPDHIIVPVGNGSLLLGLLWGFEEMLQDGRVKQIPSLHAVQSHAYQPLVTAYHNKEWPEEISSQSTVAIGIKIANPPRLDELIEACRVTGGLPITVFDEEIIEWQARLNRLEGLFVEPTSATVIAAAERLVCDGIIASDQHVLFPLTGFGFKEPMPSISN